MFMFNANTNVKVHWIGLTHTEMREQVSNLGTTTLPGRPDLQLDLLQEN